MPGEPDAAYAYYLHYRDLGPTRNLGDVAKYFDVSLGHVKNLSSKHSWKERIHEWDMALADDRADEIGRVSREVAAQTHEVVSELCLKTARVALDIISDITAETLTAPQASIIRSVLDGFLRDSSTVTESESGFDWSDPEQRKRILEMADGDA